MKKCPFCAEEIQEEAIKCKHCGEWLNDKRQHLGENPSLKNDVAHNEILKCDDCGIEQSSDSFTTGSSICKECSAKNLHKSDKKHEKENLYVPLKQKGRWGWGWFLLSGIYIASVQRAPYYHSPSLLTSVIPLLGLAILLTSYFWFRNRMIRKGLFAKKIWMASFISGFFSYLVISILVIASLNMIGKIQEIYETKEFFLNRGYLKKLEQLKEEESKIISALNFRAESTSDIERNLNILDNYLAFMKRKYAISNDFFEFLKNLSKSRNDKVFIDEVNKIEILKDKNYDIVQKSLKALITYYKTGDKNSWNVYEEMWNKHNLLEKEINTMLNNITQKIS